MTFLRTLLARCETASGVQAADVTSRPPTLIKMCSGGVNLGRRLLKAREPDKMPALAT